MKATNSLVHISWPMKILAGHEIPMKHVFSIVYDQYPFIKKIVKIPNLDTNSLVCILWPMKILIGHEIPMESIWSIV